MHEVGSLSNGFGKDSTVGDPCERVVKEYFTIAEEKTGIFAGLYCFFITVWGRPYILSNDFWECS